VFAVFFAGEVLGIAGGIAVAGRLRLATTPGDVTPYDTVVLGVLGGVGFTVSLLLADLAYDGTRAAHAKTAVLAASVLSALVAAALLRRGARR
jgi:Na+:H+ antiporter, NhaA family